MEGAPPRLGRVTTSDHVGQCCSASEGALLGKVLLDLSSNAAGEPLLAIGIEHIPLSLIYICHCRAIERGSAIATPDT